jgi:threonine/homoserine/homoserine lactone efflux protein
LIHAAPLAGFALVALGLVLTPGPNRAYLVSRAVTQGRSAGLVSLGGVGLGFIVYLLLAAFGIVNACIVASAGTVAQFLQGQPAWARAQRYLMGGVLGVLATRMALDSRR